jgi:dienelactone hydrolase
MVAADWYRPAADAPSRDGVIFAHGFMRSPVTMSDHARTLAARGVTALVPRLPWRTDPARNADALRALAAQWRAGTPAPGVERVVLVGFSAGGLAALLAARDDSPFAGIVLLDPHEPRAGPGLAAAPAVRAPVTMLIGAPSSCNGNARAARWPGALQGPVSVRQFPQATHCDFEAPSDLLCRLLCGGRDEGRAATIAESLQHTLLSSPAAPLMRSP